MGRWDAGEETLSLSHDQGSYVVNVLVHGVGAGARVSSEPRITFRTTTPGSSQDQGPGWSAVKASVRGLVASHALKVTERERAVVQTRQGPRSAPRSSSQ